MWPWNGQTAAAPVEWTLLSLILCRLWNTWGDAMTGHTWTQESLFGSIFVAVWKSTVPFRLDKTVNTPQTVSLTRVLKAKRSLTRRLMANTCAPGRLSVWGRRFISSYRCAACAASCACKCGRWVLRVYNTTIIDFCGCRQARYLCVCVDRNKVTERFCLFRLQSDLKHY